MQMNREMNQPLSRPEMISLLQEHGVSPTVQRIEIAQMLFAKPQHITAEEVLEAVNQEKNLVSKATVYNTLGLFARSGLIREVFVDPTKVVYDSNTAPHQHFYDIDNGKLIDIPVSELQFSGMPTLPEGMEMDSIDVVVKIRKTD